MDIFQALAEPNRRNIVELLSNKGKLSASTISENFQITPQAISQHLKVLREADIIEVEKKAQQRLYQLNPKKMQELGEWVKKMTQIWDKRFAVLDKLFEQEKIKFKKG